MTALERQLGKTFRAARAAEPGGWPCCPRCFDGEDVRSGFSPLKSHPAVKRYYCRCCRYQFSDLSGSPLQGFDRPLALWAYLLLGGDPKGLMADRRSSAPAQLRAAGVALLRTGFGRRWVTLLREQGITLAGLQQGTMTKRRTT